MTSKAKSTEQAWLTDGRFLWERSYKLHPGDDLLSGKSIEEHVCANGVGRELFPEIGEPEAQDKLAILYGVAVAKWVDCGAPILTCDETYGAALACTRIDRSNADDIRVQWESFVVRLPPGLLPTGFIKRPGAYVSHIRCLQLRLPHGTGSSLELFLDGSNVGFTGGLQAGPLRDTLFLEEEFHRLDASEDAVARGDALVDAVSAKTLMTFAQRVTVGLLYTMQHTANWSDNAPTGKGARPARRHGPPTHRCIVLGAPVSVKRLVPAVREACLHGGRTPAFQSVVRGHYKRQVTGSDRCGRKVIWIEPYWRGPEDAPILARPYRSVGAP